MEYNQMLLDWEKRRKQIMRWRESKPPRTIRDIAAELRISTQRVCQLMKKERGK